MYAKATMWHTRSLTTKPQGTRKPLDELDQTSLPEYPWISFRKMHLVELQKELEKVTISADPCRVCACGAEVSTYSVCYVGEGKFT